MFVLLIFSAYGVSPLPADAAEQAVPVAVAVVERAVIDQEIPLSGTAIARRRSELSSEVDGLVADMLVDEGDTVKRGDVLILLDKTLSELETLKAAAALEEAHRRHQEAVRQRDEMGRLVNKRHVAETDYKARIAEADIRSAAIKRLRSEHKRRQEMVKRHAVKAPFDGVIASKQVEVGEWTEAGSAVLELVEIDRLRIDVPVPQRYFTRIKLNSPVTLRFDAFPEQVFEAVVTRKIPVGHPSARTFPVRIEIDNPDRLVAPGMSARVVFLLKPSDREEAVLMLPRDAVVKLPDGSERVWRIDGDEETTRAESVNIVTGRGVGAFVEMKRGAVKAGDRIVVRGNESLKSGQAVRIVEHE